MQVDPVEGVNPSFRTINLSTEPSSPMDFEQQHGCNSCAGHEAGHSKKTKSRPANKSRAAPSDGDRTSVKLRNSCRSCAASKVRCDREKPVCSRCDARDLPCEYLQSKRPGRVPGASLRQKEAKQATEKVSHIRNDSIAQAVDTHVNSRDASLLAAPFRMEDFTLDLHQQHARRATSPGEDAELGSSYACNAPVAPRALATAISDMDDTLDLVVMDAFWPMEDDYGNLVDIDLANFANISASPYTSNGTGLTTPTRASSAVPSSSLSNMHLQDMLGMTAPSPGTSQSSIIGPSSKSSSPSCNCMTRALEILKNLSSDESPEPSSVAAEHYTQRVLLDNKEDIDANLAMLACRACSNDRFLLMVLLMIAAKILTRYASAAALCRSCTSSNMSSTSTPVVEHTSFISDHTNPLMEMSRAWGGVCMMLPAPEGTCEAPTSCREAVQRVLRELHRLQRLLTQLTIRRESLRGEDESRVAAAGSTDTFAGPFAARDHNGSQIGSRSAASPGSTASAVQTPQLHDDALGLVERDVRNGLSILSTVIRDLLNNS